MALPFLESASPFRTLASTTTGLGAAAAAGGAPRRMAFIYVPNGANMPDWTPKAEGTNYELPYILKPLEAHKADFNVLTGLTQDAGRAKDDGAGDHARASGTWLTSAVPDDYSALTFPGMTGYILAVGNTAGQRAIMIGIALGIAATSLKVLLGVDRSYLGSDGD